MGSRKTLKKSEAGLRVELDLLRGQSREDVRKKYDTCPLNKYTRNGIASP